MYFLPPHGQYVIMFHVTKQSFMCLKEKSSWRREADYLTFGLELREGWLQEKDTCATPTPPWGAE